MAGLNSIQQNFHLLSYINKEKFIRLYRARRYDDMQKPATYGVKAKSKKSIDAKFKELKLSPEEIVLATQLGLKPKDILQLRKINT